MIHKLYNLTAKGLLKALSFILAAVLFATIWVNSTAFALSFGGKTPYLAMLVFYGMAIYGYMELDLKSELLFGK